MQIDAFLPIVKLVGFSTYDLIRQFKKQTDFSGKIGHSGTLDPFASGLVILLLGKATKLFSTMQHLEKEYFAAARLAYSSTTLDIEGQLQPDKNTNYPTQMTLSKTLKQYEGTYNQSVPMFSAAKHQGQPLYKLARKKQIVTKTKKVNIRKLKIIVYKPPLVNISIVCHSGVYVRQLVVDIFQEHHLKTFLFSLERIRIGPFNSSQALMMNNWSEWSKYLLPLSFIPKEIYTKPHK